MIMEFIYDKFVLFFDAFHNIQDLGNRCMMVFKIIELLKNGKECDGIKGLI